MRDYNVLYDWLERNKLVLYVDNFVKGGFDIVSVRGITPEVSCRSLAAILPSPLNGCSLGKAQKVQSFF